MKKVFWVVMVLMGLVSIAGAEEALPYFDSIKDGVKFVRTQEESLWGTLRPRKQEKSLKNQEASIK